MKKDGTWGDNYELYAISRMFSARIEIYHLNKHPIVIYDDEDSS